MKLIILLGFTFVKKEHKFNVVVMNKCCCY